ncbi:unnamed protein product [Penicillium camemberti]|uniref:Str. FM013 n=1 Tax=Penicillium camemberti (strain FM 013) TaxID=1429867 RepID=A0A0G4PB56_PENC3|nr:unnamed protein product [Penicillium camemberti]
MILALAYTYYPPGAVDKDGRPGRRRHLMQLWLLAPESEGGWKLPYRDTLEKKREVYRLTTLLLSIP